jgi:hypothetical protein
MRCENSVEKALTCRLEELKQLMPDTKKDLKVRFIMWATVKDASLVFLGL